MKKLFFIILFILENNPKSDSQVLPLWQVSFNDSIPETNYSDKSKLDNEGNIIIVADGTNGSGTGTDYIIIKYNPLGVKLWNRRFSGTGNNSDYPRDLVIDRYNNIYVTGRSWGGATRNDYLTLKYNPEGNLLWSRRFDGLVSRNDEAYAMALDSNENVYVTGFASYDYSNGHELSEMLTVKYNTLGNQIWVRGFRGLSDQIDWGYSIVCDRKNNAIVSGFTYSSNLNFTDIVSIKYDSSGNDLWQRRFYNNGDDFIRPLFSIVDANDNLIVVSYYKGESNLMDYLTYKYDSSGNLLWSNTFDGERLNDWVEDVVIDIDNNIYVTGSCAYNITGFDYLTIKYSPLGQEMWHNRINDSADVNGFSGDLAAAMAIDNYGNLLVFGRSIFWEYYGSVLLYNSKGNLIYKFKNYNFQTAISILSDKQNNILINGVTGSKIFTAKYLNIISGINYQNSELDKFSTLYQNYPNPFNPSTALKFKISSPGFVSLKVYDILGKEIKTLVYENKSAGDNEIKFDGSNFGSGIYYYSLCINNILIDTKRMILLK